METITIIKALLTTILLVVGISSTLLVSMLDLALGTFGLIIFMIGIIDLILISKINT